MDSYSSISTFSHHYQDLFVERSEGGDDFSVEFLCPFCTEDYDVVSLCCHIDDHHPLQAKIGLCPVCGKKVGMDLVRHVTMQHGNVLRNKSLCEVKPSYVCIASYYMQRKRRIRKGGSNSTFSTQRKELQGGALQSLLGGTAYIASSNSEPDPLSSSFMFNPVVADESVSVPPCPSIEDALVKQSSEDDFLERKPQQVELSEEDQVKKARRFGFVQGLLMSTILEDKLSLNL